MYFHPPATPKPCPTPKWAVVSLILGLNICLCLLLWKSDLSMPGQSPDAASSANSHAHLVPLTTTLGWMVLLAQVILGLCLSPQLA